MVARIDLGAKNNESISSISVVCRDPEGKVVAEASKNAPFSEDLPSFSIGFVVPEPRLWWSWENGEQPMYSLSIKIDGEDTVELDVSNCLPFLLYADYAVLIASDLKVIANLAFRV